MSQQIAALDFSGDGQFDTEVVGESHYQPALRDLAARSREARVLLMPEPTNRHDPHAIRVIDDRARTLGYLPRDAALDYAPCFAMVSAHGHQAGMCPARIFGGDSDRPSLGIWLNLKSADTLLADLDETFGAAPVVPASKPDLMPSPAAEAKKVGVFTWVVVVFISLTFVGAVLKSCGLG